MTQLRAYGAFTGRGYGSFHGKKSAPRKLTQHRAYGPFTGVRYGSFHGKPESSVVIPPTPPDVGSLVPWSQARWVRGWPKVHIPIPRYLHQAQDEDEIVMEVIRKFLEELQKPRS